MKDNNFKLNLISISKNAPQTSEIIKEYPSEPLLQFEDSKSGLKTIRRNGVYLHSAYDPKRECSSSCSAYLKNNSTKKIHFIFGAGLFYHIIELKDKLEPESKIVIFEPDMELLVSVLCQFNLTELLEQMTLLVPQSAGRYINDNFAQNSFQPDNVGIYYHKPSIRFDEKPYADFQKNLTSAIKTERKSFRILLVGPIYGGSLPIYNYCKDALEKCGHEVFGIDNSVHRNSFNHFSEEGDNPIYSKKMLSDFTKLLSSQIVSRAIDKHVNIVLGIAQSPFSPEAARQLRKAGITTAYWFMEDFRTLTYWKFLANEFDFFFTIQKDDFFEELKTLGCKNHHYLPVAADPDFHKKEILSQKEKENSEFKSDISFVGAGYFNRRRTFMSLIDRDFKIWGNDWNLNSPLAKKIQRKGERVLGKIIINISASRLGNQKSHLF